MGHQSKRGSLMQSTPPSSSAVIFHVPAGRTIPGVNADIKAAAVPPVAGSSRSSDIHVGPATALLGDPVAAATPQTRTLSQRVVQAFKSPASFFRGILGGVQGRRPDARDDEKAIQGAGDGPDDIASDVRTEASGLSRAGRHRSMSEMLDDASTSLGYRFSELPVPDELGVLDEVFGQPRSDIIKGYASQPEQLPVARDEGDGVPGSKKWLASLNPGDVIAVGRFEVEFRHFTWIEGVQHLTVDTTRPDKPDRNDILRYQAVCEEMNGVPAEEGLVHLPLPMAQDTKGGVS